MWSLVNVVMHVIPTLGMAVVVQEAQVSLLEITQVQVEADFLVCLQEAEGQLLLLSPVEAVEHPLESIPIPLVAVEAVLVVAAKEQTLSPRVEQEHWLPVELRRPVLHNARWRLPQERNIKVAAHAARLPITQKVAAAVEVATSVAAAEITKPVRAVFKTEVVVEALVTSTLREPQQWRQLLAVKEPSLLHFQVDVQVINMLPQSAVVESVMQPQLPRQRVVTAWLLCNGQFRQQHGPTLHLVVLQWQ